MKRPTPVRTLPALVLQDINPLLELIKVVNQANLIMRLQLKSNPVLSADVIMDSKRSITNYEVGKLSIRT